MWCCAMDTDKDGGQDVSYHKDENATANQRDNTTPVSTKHTGDVPCRSRHPGLSGDLRETLGKQMQKLMV